MSILASGEFWAFVGVDRRHLHAPHARAAAPVRLRRAAELRPRRVHGDRRVHDGDPRREGRLEHVGRRAARDRSPLPLAGVAGRPADAPSAGRLLRDRHDRLQRDRPLRRDQRGRPHGRPQGTINLAGAGRHRSYNGLAALPELAAGGARHLGSKDVDDARLVWTVALACSALLGAARRRGAACSARSARTRTPPPRSGRTSSATSCRRSRSGRPRRPRRALLRLAVLVLQPRRLRAAH